MRDISTTVPMRAAARKFPHGLTPDEVEAIRAVVSKLPGGYVVKEGQTRRAMVVVAAPAIKATGGDIQAGNLADDYPSISFRRAFGSEVTGGPEVMVSAWWPGSGGADDLPVMRSLEGALSILPALATQWVRS